MFSGAPIMNRRKLFQLLGTLGAWTALPAHAQVIDIDARTALPASQTYDYGGSAQRQASPLPRIGIVSVGGSGRRVVTRCLERLTNLSGTVEINQHAAHYPDAFENAPWANDTILIGEGCGRLSTRQVAHPMALEQVAAIEAAVKRFDLVYVVAGLGGTTGTGVAPLVAEIAQRAGIFTICLVSTPLEVQGENRAQTAMLGLSELRKHNNSVFVVDLERLLARVDDNMTQDKFFALADQMFLNLYRPINAALFGCGMVDCDYKDLKRVLTEPSNVFAGYLGDASMGSATAEGENRLMQATMAAIDHPLLGRDALAQSIGVLVSIRSRAGDLTLGETKKILNIVRTIAPIKAYVVYIAHSDESLGESLEVSILVTGVLSQAKHWKYVDIDEDMA